MSYRSRTCPFCGMLQNISEESIKKSEPFVFTDEYENARYQYKIEAITCISKECNKTEVLIKKFGIDINSNFVHSLINSKEKATFSDVPLKTLDFDNNIKTKLFPDYIPEIILQDYKEAKLIQNLSPKASATLSRRCLQTMIRDFWSVKDVKSLHHEIEAIKDKIDSNMYEAIMALKSIGNIGAHPEKDINIIVDVEPGDADELVWLIETLIEDWYIMRHDRENRTNKIKSINAGKQLERNNNP